MFRFFSIITTIFLPYLLFSGKCFASELRNKPSHELRNKPVTCVAKCQVPQHPTFKQDVPYKGLQGHGG